MKAEELAYWREQYAKHGLVYLPRQGSHGGPAPRHWDQTGFRWRYDDGDEGKQESDGGATWASTKNQLTLDWPLDKPIRLRYLYDRTAQDTSAHRANLRGSLNLGTYQVVYPTNNGGGVRFIGSYWILSGQEPTDFTGRVGTGTWGNSSEGGTYIQTNLRDSFDIIPSAGQFEMTPRAGGNADMEAELALVMDSAEVNIGDTVDLKVQSPANTDMRSYVNTPQLVAIAAEAAPATQRMLISP